MAADLHCADGRVQIVSLNFKWIVNRWNWEEDANALTFGDISRHGLRFTELRNGLLFLELGTGCQERSTGERYSWLNYSLATIYRLL
jgi:hypothetical protein